MVKRSETVILVIGNFLSEDGGGTRIFGEVPFFVNHLIPHQTLITFYSMVEPRKQNRWVLIDKTTNNRLGTCGYHLWNPDHKEVEIGFELLEQYTGKGYMQEAVEAIIEFARQKMKVERINAIVSINNINCIKLLEKLRFFKVGEEETEFRGHMYFHHIYALEIKPNLKSNPGG